MPPTTHSTRTSTGQSASQPRPPAGGGASGAGPRGWGRDPLTPACGCAWTSPARDTFIVTLGNAVTSILAGFAIFSVLGYMSQELGVPVDQVAKAGMWLPGAGGGGSAARLDQ